MILGIDYGRRKIGLAIADGPLADPYEVIHYNETEDLFNKLVRLIKSLDVEKIVIGVSEGAMAIEIKNFAKVLGKQITIPIEEYDETLTSKDAQRLAQEAGISKKKRRGMEDAYAATLMLQEYLDSK